MEFVALVVVGFALAGCLLVLRARARKRAAVQRLLDEHGWAVHRDGEITTLTPATGDWAVRSRRAFAVQQSVPGTHIVTSTWSAPTPRMGSGALLVGPSPPGPARAIAVALIDSLDPKLAGWIGMGRVGGGQPLQHVLPADPRLLVLGTAEAAAPGTLVAVADAVEEWCARYDSEREQPALSLSGDGLEVRVRVDVMSSAARLAHFVALCEKCRAAVAGSCR
ncbi:MAG: hypothetical protein U5N53_25900 [Mycobacterium sp.]|nr:hypothetical protein [Mycobacterium sp.]